MKKVYKISGVLAAAAVILVAANAVSLLAEDRQAPVITLPQTDLTYSGEMKETLLLDGVTATDNRDGDVTDSLRIGEILPSADGSRVTVIYIARDSSNNISQASRVLPAEGTAAPENTGSGTGDGNQTDSSADQDGSEAVTPSPVPSGETAPEPVVTEEPAAPDSDPDETGRQENEEAIAALAPEAPRLYLSQYAVTVEAGSDFNALGYVSDVTDDVDSRDTLFTRISIDGSVDTDTPGTYDVYLYANDSDGNSSNRARLSVTVE